MAFWVIFPLAALGVIAGWTFAIVRLVKRLRSGNRNKERHHRRYYPRPRHPHYRSDWNVIDTATQDGTHYAPLS
jgi:hypothetical protein